MSNKYESFIETLKHYVDEAEKNPQLSEIDKVSAIAFSTQCFLKCYERIKNYE